MVQGVCGEEAIYLMVASKQTERGQGQGILIKGTPPVISFLQVGHAPHFYHLPIIYQIMNPSKPTDEVRTVRILPSQSPQPPTKPLTQGIWGTF
jgi:hypothetical protein